jgi:hypothetical protein
MPGIRLWFQQSVEGIVNAQAGANKAEAGLNRRGALIFSRAMAGLPDSNSPPPRNLFAASALQNPASPAQSQPSLRNSDEEN